MRTQLRIGSFLLIWSLLTSSLALAEDRPEASPPGYSRSSGDFIFVPAGATVVRKWVVEQLPGRIFDSSAEAIAAGYNAGLTRMDLHSRTFINQPAQLAANDRQ